MRVLKKSGARLECIPTFQERIDSLLALRHGYGANTTGGANGVETIVTDFNDLRGYLEDMVPRWIHFAPNLWGQTWLMPLTGLTGQNLTRKIFVQANKTIDMRRYDGTWNGITWQYPNANEEDGDQSTPPVVSRQQRYVSLAWGNVIVCGLKIVGDLIANATYDNNVGNVNGSTDGLVIHAGKDYFRINCSGSRMSDETWSITDLSLGKPNQQVTNDESPGRVTDSCMWTDRSKNAMIVGDVDSTIGELEVTQTFNRHTRIFQGRAPGLYIHCKAHVVNCVTEEFSTTGGFAQFNADVESEYCVSSVLEDQSLPKPFNHPVNNAHRMFTGSGNGGRWRDDSSYFFPNVGGASATTQSPRLTAGASAPLFAIPNTPEYRNYTRQEGTKAEILAYVRNHAGAERMNIPMCA